MVQLGGLEPPTSGSTIRRSNQLSYSCIWVAALRGGLTQGAEPTARDVGLQDWPWGRLIQARFAWCNNPCGSRRCRFRFTSQPQSARRFARTGRVLIKTPWRALPDQQRRHPGSQMRPTAKQLGNASYCPGTPASQAQARVPGSRIAASLDRLRDQATLASGMTELGFNRSCSGDVRARSISSWENKILKGRFNPALSTSPHIQFRINRG